MPSTYSSNLRLELQATGENTATWGTKANNTFEMIEDGIAGYLSIAMSDANMTLTTVNGSTDQARMAIINYTGTLTAARTITIPSTSKIYYMRNSTTGGFSLNIKTSGGNTITIANGNSIHFFCDGTNCTKAFEIDLNEVTNGTLAVASGGTGSTTASAARTALGVAIGTDVQAYDAALNSIAGLTTSANQMIYTTGSNVYTTTSLSAFARTLLDDADAATMRATLAITETTEIPSGTIMLFQQTSAPTGWTKITTHNNKALRVVSGTVSSGGTVAFTTAFASKPVSGTISNETATGTIGGTALTEAQLPAHDHSSGTLAGTAASSGSHTHTYQHLDTSGSGATAYGTGPDGEITSSTSSSGSHTHTVDVNSGNTGSAGSGATHTHTFTGTAHDHTFSGTAIDLAVQYVDIIFASKN